MFVKGSTGNGGFVRESESRFYAYPRYGELFTCNAVDADRLRDVIKLVLAEVYRRKLHLAGNFFVHLAGDANPPRLRNRFETSGNVDAIAVDACVVKDNVAVIDSNAEVHTAGFFYAGRNRGSSGP
jgi:hypothetical protein